ncbi:MAG: GxxExxY protein [Longimicrobiales bacterium]
MGNSTPKQSEINDLTRRIIGAAIAVHRELGPGLLESLYQEAFGLELGAEKLSFEAQKAIPAYYRGVRLSGGYRIDFLVEGRVVVELKAADRIEPVFTAQLLTYMKLTSCQVGLLTNFNVPRLTNGIKRIVQDYDGPLPGGLIFRD